MATIRQMRGMAGLAFAPRARSCRKAGKSPALPVSRCGFLRRSLKAGGYRAYGAFWPIRLPIRFPNHDMGRLHKPMSLKRSTFLQRYPLMLKAEGTAD